MASLLYPACWQKSGPLSNCYNVLPFHNICTESLLLGATVCIAASFHAKPGDYFRSLSYRHNYLPRSHWGFLPEKRKVEERIVDEGIRCFLGDVSRGWGGMMGSAHLPRVGRVRGLKFKPSCCPKLRSTIRNMKRPYVPLIMAC